MRQKMLNAQCSMLNALNHCFIDHSLTIDTCQLTIATGVMG